LLLFSLKTFQAIEDQDIKQFLTLTCMAVNCDLLLWTKNINFTSQVEDFWVMTPCSVVVGDQRFRGPCCLQLQGSMDFWNVGILPQHYMASQPRSPRIESL